MVKETGSILIEAGRRFAEVRAPRLGAALAFYAVISLTPLLVVIVGVAGQVFGAEAVRGELVGQIEGTVGTEVAILIEDALRQAHLVGDGFRVAVVGAIGLLIGATTLFANLKLSLNTIWNVQPPPSAGFLQTVRQFVMTRLLVFLVVLGIGLIVIGTLVANTVIEASAAYFADILPMPPGTMRMVNTAVSLVVLLLIFAYLFRALPDVRISWREVWLGAIVTAVLFTLGKHLLGLYLGRSAPGSAYGAAGAIVIVLVWVYYSAQIFFFGAQVTQVYASRHGKGWIPRRGFVIGDEDLIRVDTEEPEAATNLSLNLASDPNAAGAD